MNAQEEKQLEFNQGLKKGMPITLGYVPVAFTLALAVQGVCPPGCHFNIHVEPNIGRSICRSKLNYCSS